MRKNSSTLAFTKKHNLYPLIAGLLTLLPFLAEGTFFDSFIGNRVGLNQPFEDTATILGEDEILQPNSVDKVLVEVSSPQESQGQLMDIVHCYSFRNGLYGKATRALVFWTRINFETADYWREGHSHALANSMLNIRSPINQIGVFQESLTTILLSQGSDYFQLYLDIIPGPFQKSYQEESQQKSANNENKQHQNNAEGENGDDYQKSSASLQPLRYQYWPTEKLFLSLDTLFMVSETQKAYFSCSKYLGVIDFSYVRFVVKDGSSSDDEDQSDFEDAGPPALQLYTLFNGALAKEIGPLGQTETISMLGLRPSFSTPTLQGGSLMPKWNNKLFLLLENRAGDSAQLRIEEVDADQIVRSASNVAIFNTNGATLDAKFTPVEVPDETNLKSSDEYIFGACGYLAEPYQTYSISLVTNRKDEFTGAWQTDRRKEFSLDSEILASQGGRNSNNEYAECMGLVRKRESTPQNPQIDVIYTTENRVVKLSVSFQNDKSEQGGQISLIEAQIQKSIAFSMSSQDRSAAFLQPWSPLTKSFPEMYLIAARSPSSTLSSKVNDGYLFSEYYLRKLSPHFYPKNNSNSPRKITHEMMEADVDFEEKDLPSLRIQRSKLVYPPANVRYYYFQEIPQQVVVGNNSTIPSLNKASEEVAALTFGYQWIQTSNECAKLVENDYSSVETRGIQDGWTTVYSTITQSAPMKLLKDEQVMTTEFDDKGLVIDNNLFWYDKMYRARVEKEDFWGQALISLCFNETETFQLCNEQREASGQEFDYKQAAVQVKDSPFYGQAFILPSDPTIRCFLSAIKMTRIDGFSQLNLENQAKRIKVVQIGEKPYLDPHPPETFSVQATFDTSFPIGEPKDPEGNRVVMSVWLRQASKFAFYDENTRRVVISGFMTSERDVGTYPITIKLAEIVDGAQINAQRYQITLNMLEPPEVPIVEPRIVPPGTVMTQIKGWEIRMDGKFSFVMNKPIDFPSDLKEKINEALVTEPIPIFNVGEVDHLQKYRQMITIEAIAGVYSEQSNMGLSFEVVEMEPKSIELQLKFENALEISQNQEVDRIVATFRVQEYGDISVEEEYIVRRPLPRQIPSAAEAAAIEGAGASSEVASTAVMGGNFIISLILAASLNQLWALMNGLQLAVHLPIFNTVFPANANFFISFLISVATFDILPGFIIPLIFDFPEREPYSLGLMTCGYGSRYSIGNLGTCFFLILLMIFQAIACFVLSFFKDRYAFAKKHYENLRTTLFWNVFLRFFFEGYLELCFSVFVSLTDITWQDINYSVGFNNVFSLFVGAILLGLPFFIFFYYGSKMDDLDDEEFIERFGDIYDGMQMQSKAGDRWIALFYPFFFVVRRLLFALVGLFVQKQLIFQLMVVFACTVIQLIYLGWFRPFEDQRLVNLEIMNECTSLILLYHLMLFTDFVPEAATRYLIGWSFIFFVVANMAVHFTILIKDTIADIKENGCCKKEEDEDEKDEAALETIKEEASNDSKFDMLQADSPKASPKGGKIAGGADMIKGKNEGPDYESFSDWDEDKLGGTNKSADKEYNLEAITWKDLGNKFMYHVHGIVKPPKKPRVVKKRLNHVHVAAENTQEDHEIEKEESQQTANGGAIELMRQASQNRNQHHQPVVDDSQMNQNEQNALTERGSPEINFTSDRNIYSADPDQQPNLGVGDHIIMDDNCGGDYGASNQVNNGDERKLLSAKLIDFQEGSDGQLDENRSSDDEDEQYYKDGQMDSSEDDIQDLRMVDSNRKQPETNLPQKQQNQIIDEAEIDQSSSRKEILAEDELLVNEQIDRTNQQSPHFQQDQTDQAHLNLLKGALSINKNAANASNSAAIEQNIAPEDLSSQNKRAGSAMLEYESNPEPQFPVDGAPPSDLQPSELNQPVNSDKNVEEPNHQESIVGEDRDKQNVKEEGGQAI